MNFKKILAMSVFTLACTSSFAQTEEQTEEQRLGYKPQPYGFVQVQGGLSTLFTRVSCNDIIMPTFSVGVGGMFTPIVGARLHVNGLKSKSGFFSSAVDIPGQTSWNDSKEAWVLDKSKTYKWNYINTNLDLMLNINNIFSKNKNHLFNVYLIGGIGLNYAWNNSEFEDLTKTFTPGEDISNAWGDGQTPRRSLLGHNFRVGLLTDFNICKHWSVGAEVDLNSLDDRFNSVYKNGDDWMLTAQLSVTYKFGFKKAAKPAPAPVAPVVREPEPAPAPVPVPVVVEEKPAPKKEVVEEKPLHEEIFYAIRESDPNPEAILNRVVEWNKKYPNKTISVEGYADKGTGNAALNLKYSKQRAEKIATALKNKGVPASALVVKSYGDSVQPFGDNDKNRCVIINGK